MSNELILRDSDILNPQFGFEEKMTVAAEVANSLKKVIDEQGLAVKIQGNQYVTAEGWSILGTMLGCSPYVVEVAELPTERKADIIYKAEVEIRQGTTVLSKASAIAERNSRQKERFAVYSMAQTRALGKAYRLCLSWIVKLAGYEPTPAEEMPKFTARDLQKNESVKQEVILEDGTTYEVHDMTQNNQSKPVLNELIVEDPDPLQSRMNNLVNELKNECKEITKSNLRVKASYLKRENKIDANELRDLIKFINENCPEDKGAD